MKSHLSIPIGEIIPLSNVATLYTIPAHESLSSHLSYPNDYCGIAEPQVTFILLSSGPKATYITLLQSIVIFVLFYYCCCQSLTV